MPQETKKYFFCTVSFRQRGDDSTYFENRVFKGGFVELILSVHGEESEDNFYTAFALISWCEITEEEFSKIDGEI